MYCATIDSSLFSENRKRLVAQLKPGSIAVLHSNHIYPSNADALLPFVQQTDLFYLTGIAQEETTLLIYKNSKSEVKEYLFIKKTSPEIAVWEGHKYTKEEAKKLSGIELIYWQDDFKSVLSNTVVYADYIYLNTNEHRRAVADLPTRDSHFIEWCQSHYPLHKYERLAPVLHQLRAIKNATEVALIQQACNITGKAFERILKFVRPDVWEFEIEAEIYYSFLVQKSQGPGYQNIIASGANSCVLHYVANNQQCQEGDLLLLDFGAKYTHYNADMTRTIPVSGKFTKRQRQVYQAVLNVQKEAIKLLKVGNTLEAYHTEVGKIMESQLIEIGLLKKHEVKKQNPKQPLYRKYFMHGTSHHLGLDVHDYGQDDSRKFEAGMVFTCEPGIYIPEEAIGIRLENDILITENEPKDLMAHIPIEPDQIQEIMQK